MASRGVLSMTQFGVLALWLGASILFSAVVAPALFAVLPTRAMAGDVVGRVLPVIFYAGIVAGAIVVALDTMMRGSLQWRGPASLGFLTALSCGIAQWIVSPRIERLRAEIGGPIDAVAPTDPRRLAFGRLHGVSVGWLGLAMLAAGIAMFLAARASASRDVV